MCLCIEFLPDDLPKPKITVHPVTTAAVLGKDVRLTCTAASSSSSPMTFTWRKDQETLRQAEVENFAHVRASDGGVMEYTTILHLRHVTFNHEGRYQCIISNHFGSSYSNKARVTVNGTFNTPKLHSCTFQFDHQSYHLHKMPIMQRSFVPVEAFNCQANNCFLNVSVCLIHNSHNSIQ